MTITRSNRPAEGLGPMISGVTQDLTALVKDQVALTKSELRESARTAVASSAMLVVAAFVALLALIFLFVTLAYVLVALGLPTWAGFGIVTLVLLLVAALLGLIGAKRVRSVRGPERSLQQLAETQALLPGHRVEA